jgi:transcriptional regulator with XRE-family HTH domain
MLWKQTLTELVALGLKQSEIAEKVGATQGYISELANGKATNPGYAIGAKITALLESERKRATKRPKARA